jgi:putative membrane protein
VSEAPEPVGYTSTLANERTFLAWVRTSLGLIAGGVALDQFVAVARGSIAVKIIAFVVILLGAMVSLIGLGQWGRANVAMEGGKPIGRSRVVPVLSIAVMIVAVAIAVILLLNSSSS